MRAFFSIYGKWCSGFVLTVLMLSGVFILLRIGWKFYGIAADGGKAGVLQSSLREEPPVIEARSCRLIQNTEVKFTELASARDGNGDDLTDELLFFDRNGNSLSGYMDTKTPGKYVVTIVADSLFNGKRSRKDIVVLVDGSVSE